MVKGKIIPESDVETNSETLSSQGREEKQRRKSRKISWKEKNGCGRTETLTR